MAEVPMCPTTIPAALFAKSTASSIGILAIIADEIAAITVSPAPLTSKISLALDFK